MLRLACTRFSDATWEENQRYRQRVGVAAIYGTDVRISPTRVTPGEWLAVFEMNNTTNRVMGIGVICSTPLYTSHTIYVHQPSFNLHIYRGRIWFDRDTVIQFDSTLLREIEQVLFKGRSHLKRLSGITVLGEKPFSHWPEVSLPDLLRRVWVIVCTRCRVRPPPANGAASAETRPPLPPPSDQEATK